MNSIHEIASKTSLIGRGFPLGGQGGQEGGRHLVAFTVVLQTARALAVAALAVPAVRFPLLPLADLGLESAGIAVQTRLGRIKK